VVISTDPAGHDHVRARGMHDLRDVATVLDFIQINSEVSSTMSFPTHVCATLPSYTKDVPVRSIRLGGMLLGQFFGLLQMFMSSLSKSPKLS
jgi:hypothetical protein